MHIPVDAAVEAADPLFADPDDPLDDPLAV
jgi:hypothetical protein